MQTNKPHRCNKPTHKCDARCTAIRSRVAGTIYSEGVCLAEDESDISGSPYGIDPAFLPTSHVFNGKLHSEDYYTEKEHTAGMLVCVYVCTLRRYCQRKKTAECIHTHTQIHTHTRTQTMHEVCPTAILMITEGRKTAFNCF